MSWLGGFLRSAASGLFGGAYDIGKDAPGFLEGTSGGSGPIRDVQRAMGRRVCRKWARGETPKNVNFKDTAYRDLCKPYLVDIGEWPGDGTVDPLEGRCDGSPYTVTTPYINDSGNPQTLPQNVFGPVQNIVLTLGPASPTGTQTLRRDMEARLTPTGPIQNVGAGPVLIQTGTAGQSSITRTDGQPDNCGPPVINPEPPITTPISPPDPITIITPFGPVVIVVDLDENWDVVITTPDYPDDDPIDPIDPTDPNDGQPFGPSGPGDAGEPGITQTTGSEGEASGMAGDGEVLIGVLVEVASALPPVRTNTAQFGILYRGAGYVYLGTESKLDQQPEASIMVSPQFFYAPEDSTHWAVYANIGAILDVTPYYKKIKETG